MTSILSSRRLRAVAVLCALVAAPAAWGSGEADAVPFPSAAEGSAEAGPPRPPEAGSEVKDDLSPRIYQFEQAQSTAQRTGSLVAAFADICTHIDAPDRIPGRAAAWGFIPAPADTSAHFLHGEQGVVWAGMRVGQMDSILIYSARRRFCALTLRQPLDQDTAIRTFDRLVEAIPRRPGPREDRSLVAFGANRRRMVIETVSARASSDGLARNMVMTLDGNGRSDAPISFVHGLIARQANP